jgi:adenine phosphoribosyltransferase
MNRSFSSFVTPYKNFPKLGVVFWDFTPMEENPEVMKQAISEIIRHFQDKAITKVVAVESKGFIIGSVVSYEMQKPLVLIRKPNLMPGTVLTEKFVKEYGVGEYQMKQNTISSDDNVLIVYDILAGSGASQAAINLVIRQGGTVGGLAFITELEYLHGREELNKYNVFSLVKIASNTSHES